MVTAASATHAARNHGAAAVNQTAAAYVPARGQLRQERTAGRNHPPAGHERQPVSPDSIPRGPGLFEITREGAGRAITNVRKLAGTPDRPGRALINTAALGLGLLDAGLFAISLAAQYQYILRARHQSWPAIVEAAALDAGMIIFSLLALGLARAGQNAPVERALIVVFASGSAAMNYAAADVTSVRSVAAYVMPPIALAIVTDRVVAVVRRHVLGMETERSAWAALGRAAAAVAATAGRVILYGLRLILAPRSTSAGVRRWVLLATPLPVSPGEAPAPAGLAVPERPALEPGSCMAKTGTGPADLCGGTRPCFRHEPGVRLPGETKKAHLLRLYSQHPENGSRAAASRTATELAAHAQLSPGTARAYINAHLDAREAS